MKVILRMGWKSSDVFCICESSKKYKNWNAWWDRDKTRWGKNDNDVKALAMTQQQQLRRRQWWWWPMKSQKETTKKWKKKEMRMKHIKVKRNEEKNAQNPVRMEKIHCLCAVYFCFIVCYLQKLQHGENVIQHIFSVWLGLNQDSVLFSLPSVYENFLFSV